MTKRVPVQAVVVYRDGKNFKPPLGKAFDFTPQEVEDIMAANPAALTKVESKEINDEAEAKAKAEADAAAANEATAKAHAKAKAEADAAAAKGKGSVAPQVPKVRGADSL